ncbi:MAG: ABC transporter permease [Christensenella hongkongensis]|uniref:ABC transporter permease n=1 Tax=Christensenella hongkongensis TaxID=270498 RepID=UPI0026726A73|nr:ABC transporter permease [Christensenella hongkongensis]MDY3003204.1 ABC transporter permease [Christensenella hongkongensis]
MTGKKSLKGFVAKDINLTILIVAIAGIIIVLSAILGNKFLSPMNFQSMAYQIPEFGFIALAMMICMLTGGIDLSVVSVATMSSVLAAMIMTGITENGGDAGYAIGMAVLAALGVSLLCGLFNGILIAKCSVLPILATLSTMILYTGIAMAITDGAGITGFPKEFIKFGSAKVFDIPVIFILFLAAAVLIALMLRRTKLGRSLYLYGENSTVSLFSGIRNERLVVITYTLSGLLCGIASIIMMSRVNSARVGYGDTYQLQAILVCALGGVSPDGGKGKVIGVVIAILVLQILQSGFTLLNFAPFVKSLIWGSVLIVIMITNYLIETKKAAAAA